MRIFLDLDETLVHSIPLRGGGSGRRRIVRCSDGSGFGVIERPLAKQIIADCQAIAPVAILTTGMQDYAESVCRAFDFAVGDILGAEKYIMEEPGAMDAPLALNTCPDSCLIDNAAEDFFYSRLKMAYLGAPNSNYIRIRAFNGQDPASFASEWDQIRNVVRSLVSAA